VTEAEPTPTPRGPWRAARRWLVRITLAALGIVSLVLLLAVATLPDVGKLRTGWPQRTAYMERWLRGGEGRSVDVRPVPLSRIPEPVRRAVLVSEDAGFYGHHGFDWYEVRAALRDAWERRRPPRGASTITQQLARNLYLSARRDPLRKLREALIARRLERELSKARILELYLNVIELGPGTYGVEAAARRYFGRSISEISRREAAAIAATIPSPRGNNPETATRAFRARAERAYIRAFGSSGG